MNNQNIEKTKIITTKTISIILVLLALISLIFSTQPFYTLSTSDFTSSETNLIGILSDILPLEEDLEAIEFDLSLKNVVEIFKHPKTSFYVYYSVTCQWLILQAVTSPNPNFEKIEKINQNLEKTMDAISEEDVAKMEKILQDENYVSALVSVPAVVIGTLGKPIRIASHALGYNTHMIVTVATIIAIISIFFFLIALPIYLVIYIIKLVTAILKKLPFDKIRSVAIDYTDFISNFALWVLFLNSLGTSPSKNLGSGLLIFGVFILLTAILCGIPNLSKANNPKEYYASFLLLLVPAICSIIMLYAFYNINIYISSTASDAGVGKKFFVLILEFLILIIGQNIMDRSLDKISFAFEEEETQDDLIADIIICAQPIVMTIIGWIIAGAYIESVGQYIALISIIALGGGTIAAYVYTTKHIPRPILVEQATDDVKANSSTENTTETSTES